MKTAKRVLKNDSCVLEVDLNGGAITDFSLGKNEVNPLSFRFSVDQMPENNKSGAPYQGHFLCLGRWGLPSEGEIKAGVPDHGQIANISWNATENDDLQLEMQTHSQLEGLQIKRNIQLDSCSPVFTVTESVTNTNPLGRLYNMVQHPTLGAPFLDDTTIVNCNGDIGFDHHYSKEPDKYISKWPLGLCKGINTINLSTTDHLYSSVFSFIVRKESRFGWVTAFSSTYNLMIGYLWERKDYPWINLWQDWENGNIRYRGIEFGTTGIHKPFRQIVEDGVWKVFDEKTCEYIDAGEQFTKRYLSFLCKVNPGFSGVDDVIFSDGVLTIKDNSKGQVIEVQTSFTSFYE